MYNKKRKIVKLKSNPIMEYDWGSVNPNNIIRQLREEQKQKYAELWMGNHHKGSSGLENGQSLIEYFKQNQQLELEFLFKILCVEKALSIQLHPNKSQAESLFLKNPNLYADNNEKPQMFFTLTQFQCFIGLVSEVQLEKLLKSQPFHNFKSKNIKEIIVEILNLSKQQRKQRIQILLKQIDLISLQRKQILQKISTQFLDDEGILVSCFLQYKKLQPYNCFAIDAGVPHAYLYGSCLEIMKNSDNVIRLGLTPKIKDTKNMLEIMNDTLGHSAIQVNKSENEYRWNSLIVKVIKIQGKEEINIQNRGICIVFEGQLNIQEMEMEFKKGEIFLIYPGAYTLVGNSLMYYGGYVEV